MQQMVHSDLLVGFPDSWLDVSNIILVGPPDQDYSPSITITREPLAEPMKPDKYAATQLTALQQELGPQGYRVSQEGPTTVGDMPAYQRFHTFAMPKTDIRVQQWQIYMTVETTAIVLTMTDKTTTFQKSYPVFNEALKQLKIIKK